MRFLSASVCSGKMGTMADCRAFVPLLEVLGGKRHMESRQVVRVPIEEEMQQAYLTYAMSVIVSRALPDVRDGLKPVHRRILYAMYDMGLTPEKPYKKSARIVGEVLGKYHPHSDAAVYDAMVRMAQDFSLRYPLVDGQGNFGSIDGDSAAAMRYTEARLSSVAMEMLRDIGEDTVDFVPNFDGTLQEPAVLPSAFPNLIVNGAAGIAVGMSTNIPPHNLAEVVNVLVFLIDNWNRLDEVTTSDLMAHIPGPDFPTGGVIYRYAEEKGELVDRVARLYATGKGHFVVQALVEEEIVGRDRVALIVREIPYQASKARIIERIADLVRDGRLEGIRDVRDESDRTGMRLVIELQRGVKAEDVLPDLFKFTPLQQTFGAQMLALVEGEPRTLPLKKLLLLFLQHRQEVIRRRSEFRLAKARHRAHILEGLLKALGDLDAVVHIIRRSRTVDTARQNLRKRLKITEVQAQAILDMPLKRLAQLERRLLQEEYKGVRATIAYLEDLLANPTKILDVIREELLDLRSRFGDARRTRIVDVISGAHTATELMPQEPRIGVLTREGKVFSLSPRTRRRGTAPGRGKAAPLVLVTGTTRDHVYVFTETGFAVRLPFRQFPSEPLPLSALVDVPAPVADMIALPPEVEADAVLVLVSAKGRVKRISQKDLSHSAHKLVQVMGIEAGDRLVRVLAASTKGDILLFTQGGQAIRFAADEVRVMGLSAAGVLGIKLTSGDSVVDAAWTEGAGEVWAITTTGHGKRMKVQDFPQQRRYGTGVLLLKLGKTHGRVADAAVIQGPEEVFVVTRRGNVHYLRPDNMPIGRRGTAPRPVISLSARDEVTGFLLLTPLELPKEARVTKTTPRRKATASTGPRKGTSRAKGTPSSTQRISRSQAPSSSSEPKTSKSTPAKALVQPGEAAVIGKKRKTRKRSGARRKGVK